MSNPRKFDHELARDMYADGVAPAELARFFGVSHSAMLGAVDEAWRTRQRDQQRFRRQRKAAQTGKRR